MKTNCKNQNELYCEKSTMCYCAMISDYTQDYNHLFRTLVRLTTHFRL